jgi:hypothetical protein
MSDIYNWIKKNNLWYIVGMFRTKTEYTAEIWTNLYHLQSNATIGWFGVGQSPDEALQKAYDKALVGIKDIPKTRRELQKRIYGY